MKCRVTRHLSHVGWIRRVLAVVGRSGVPPGRWDGGIEMAEMPQGAASQPLRQRGAGGAAREQLGAR
jgi:hypothetical protein